tara:strand:- start:257996 stop:261421 length:3426 start_codon:yes stop_codon:yes gene_type:complete
VTGRTQRSGDASEQNDASDISDAGCFASDQENVRLALIDLHGRDGFDGSDGQSFFQPPAGYGERGRDGGDATRPTRGKDATDASLMIDYANRNRSQVIVTGDVNSSPSIAIGDDGYIFIQAHGGKGGNGGRGGDGGPGSRGYRGRNATRFSRGGNGGPGGDGGNAGQPTDGANGGDGGEISLTVDAANTGLLMLAKGNLAAGDLGFAGERGRGGKGGPGGPGGSSYHWTETRHYTDSKGNRRSRTIHRSNPGGHSGRDGRDGMDSHYRARDAQPGNVGRLTIIVRSGDGSTQLYRSPYDLQLVSFDVASEYSVLEPDSIVSIDRIVIRNCGGMPTPYNYDVKVHLPSDDWILREGDDLILKRPLDPGETHTFEQDGLRFRLGDYVVDDPRRRPFTLRHRVSPLASLESGIHRPFRQFENGENLHVHFPVQLRAITSLNSLAPGESTRVIWAVTNVGDEPFDHEYLRRAVNSHVRLIGGDIDRKHLLFFDTDDNPHDLVKTELTLAVRDLDPGETRIFETRIGVKDQPEVVPYHGFAVGVDLYLQRPGTSDRREQFRRVDYRKTFIRVSERYRKDTGSRFLLVANHRTDVNDINKWTQMADYFGSSLDVWDVSYYGFFDLVRDVSKDQSLLEQWRGMTIIIPNNYYETPGGRTVAFDQLAKKQFLQAAANYDINFYIVGDSRTGGAEMLQNSLIPVGGDESPSRLESRKDFLRQIKRWNKYVARTGDVVGGHTKTAAGLADTELGALHEFDIQKRTILFQPKADWLQDQADALQRRLKKIDPLHRWVIVHRYDTGDTDTSWGFFKKRKVGKLEARRTLDSSKGSAVLYEVDAIDMVDDDFILSEANKHGMFLALKFEDKVDRFIRLVSERTFPRFSENYIHRPLTDQEILQIGGELADSILVDIFNEQQVARNSRTWGRWSIKSLMPKLNYLAERSLNYGVSYTQMTENTAGMDLLYDMIANLQYMAAKTMTVWDHALIPTSFFKRGRAVSKHMQERIDQIVVNIFGNEPSWWDRVTNPDDDFDAAGRPKSAKFDGMERTIADRHIESRLVKLDTERPSVERFTEPQHRKGLTYDPELLPVSARVMPGHVYDQLARAESLRAQMRKETELASRRQRSDLLVPLEIATTIASQTVTVTAQPSE